MMTRSSTDARTDAWKLQQQMSALVRAAGLHQPDRTPCGQPVPVSEAHALMELAREGSIPQRELVHRLQLEKSAVSRVVRQLFHRGWVAYLSDPSDGRANTLTLTRAGQRAADLAAVRSAKFAQVLEAIPEDDRAAVLHGLAALVKAFDDDKR